MCLSRELCVGDKSGRAGSLKGGRGTGSAAGIVARKQIATRFGLPTGRGEKPGWDQGEGGPGRSRESENAVSRSEEA
eukprot:78294-Heterocapsa_arctica.AAC.1